MPDRDNLSFRVGRFELLRAAQWALYDGDLPKEEQHRTCWCHRTIKDRDRNAGVFRTADGTGARLDQVVTCGMVHACPVCAMRICEQRRKELQEASVAWCKYHGGYVYMMTLTFPHDRDDNLPELLDKFAKALHRFKDCRTYKRVMKAAGRVGSVRSLELTWSVLNAWHPHTHDLLFAQPKGFKEGDKADDGRLQSRAIEELREAWIAALLHVGLGDAGKVSDMWAHALDIRGGKDAADYIAKFGHDEKWGLTSEITKPHAKIGARSLMGFEGHVTPFQLLEWAQKGAGNACRLFRDFAMAMKGKRLLYWSPGLCAALGLSPKKDDWEIADAPLKDEYRCGSITVDELSIIISRNALGRFIDYVARYCTDPLSAQSDILDFVAMLKTQPKVATGYVRAPVPFGKGARVSSACDVDTVFIGWGHHA